MFAGALVLSLACHNRVFAAATEERLTIVTYYPAPSGTYDHLTTTGKTYLATNPNNTVPAPGVGIGTSGPLASSALLQVGTSPGPGLFVTSGGNVGIGTTDPGTNRLYVNGDTYINDPAIGGYAGNITLLRPDFSNCVLKIQGGVIMPSGTDPTQPCQ